MAHWVRSYFRFRYSSCPFLVACNWSFKFLNEFIFYKIYFSIIHGRYIHSSASGSQEVNWIGELWMATHKLGCVFEQVVLPRNLKLVFSQVHIAYNHTVINPPCYTRASFMKCMFHTTSADASVLLITWFKLLFYFNVTETQLNN